MESDLDLALILSMGRVGFQICDIFWICILLWIKNCSWIGLDFKSMKPYGFFFGVGFALGNSLDQIMDLFFFAWIWINFFSQI